MPNKYPVKKGWKVPKQKYKLKNWSAYNQALRLRGNITMWLSEEAIAQWYVKDRIYDGTGTPPLYTDFAIITCHEIRQVFKQPLRQTEGFINSLFQLMGIPLSCPDYSVLSKRLKALNIKVPRYKKTAQPEANIHAIAIDSTGLKRFGRGEWHQEKYELSNKASWRKLHAAINQDHYFEACILTDRFSHDDQQVGELLKQIYEPIDHFSADGAYDEAPVYHAVTAHSPKVNVVIPPRNKAVESEKAAHQRNQSIIEIKEKGRMQWQKDRGYGRRNYSELGIQRYKRILGNAMHARDMDRQQQEAVIGCGVINKMTSLGMPSSYRTA